MRKQYKRMSRNQKYQYAMWSIQVYTMYSLHSCRLHDRWWNNTQQHIEYIQMDLFPQYHH